MNSSNALDEELRIALIRDAAPELFEALEGLTNWVCELVDPEFVNPLTEPTVLRAVIALRLATEGKPYVA